MQTQNRCLLIAWLATCQAILGWAGAAIGATPPRPPASNVRAITTPEGTLVNVTVNQQGHGRAVFDASLGDIQGKLKVGYHEKTFIFDSEPMPHTSPRTWPPFAHQTPLLQASLRSALPNPRAFPALSFSLRLMTYPEMSYRVALLAATSKKWDRRLGRAKRTFTNDLITSLAKSQETYGELRELFAAFGYQITLQSVEKALVERARTLPYGADLSAQGISSSTPVPFDAILWFRAELQDEPH